MMNEPLSASEKRRLAEAVRKACIRAALAGYEQAAMDGLCHEGAWEVAVGAMRMLDVERLIQASLKSKE
jgi:hypothetical protein